MTDTPIPDDEHGAHLPMNMTASVMLTGLPRDAHQALADVEAIDAGKGGDLLLRIISSSFCDTICVYPKEAGASDQRLGTFII